MLSSPGLIPGIQETNSSLAFIVRPMQNTASNPALFSIDWLSKHSWRVSAKNTAWCLLGCAIGDFAVIYTFQIFLPETNALLVMALAMIAGIVSSIALETMRLSRQMIWANALSTAMGMNLVGMLGMEFAMNATDYLLVGAAALTWWSVIPVLMAGFGSILPYNYWRLQRYGKFCH